MPDDIGKTPTPRPRRRRTDVDPTFVPPKVPRERRRPKAADRVAAPVEPAPVEPAEAAPDEAAPPEITPVEAASLELDIDAAAAAAAAAKAEADAQVEAATELATEEPGESDAEGEALAAVAATEVVATADAAVTADAAATADAAVTDDDGPVDGSGPWLPMFEDRSPDPSVCPFLRSADGDRLGPPVDAPDPANRCAALADAVPQSLRQQELVCLASGHVNCPRYLRGAAETAPVVPPAVRSGRTVTPAILISILALIGAFALSIGFVASRGDLELAAAPGASASATASGSATAPTATAGSTGSPAAVLASPSAVPTPTATRAPSPTPTATPAPTAEPTPEPTPAATPEPTPRPTPTSDRYALLVACPDRSDCWIYTVRSGDNLFSIANYFGVPLERVYTLNPWLRNTGLRAGQKIELPPPTR